MSLASSSAQNQAAAAASATNVNIETLLQEIKQSTNQSTLNTFLKGIPKDARESHLSSLLPGGQDPLEQLDPAQHTIGYLHIL